ncbi:hypothetical protein KW795_02520 [Candidatus Microgenomates bacterium]|nr:hypothetical protein [Candidatus Microgenomates bacterium]
MADIDMSPEKRAAIYVAAFDIFLAELDLLKMTPAENLDMTEYVSDLIRSRGNDNFSIGDLWNGPYKL